ncbi:uncharacterized protein LOC110736472 [Chenopodium quinoa]|uniref:uncharacterized protein LOC110736472 n=1 Tax=Chenopodium quinoa TaxID=63459 RepID=UPI000B77C1D3|nr:uncharacterized protein LOC110736472 [Chenopodium quinoa]
MEEIEEIDPGDEEEYWKIQDFKNYSKFYESNSKLSRIWKRGVSIGKKMVVTGAVVSSASFVLPPLVVLSAIGVAFSVPAGFVIVSYACGEKLLNTLLPMPLALPYEGNGPMYSDESGEYIVYGDDVDNGYEGDEDIQLEEDLRKGMEMRIELAEENNKEIENHEQYANEDELDKMSSKVSEIVEEWGYEEDLGEYNEDDEQPLNSKMIPEILKGIEEAENEISLIKKEEGEMPKDSLKAVVVEAQVGSENENNVEEVTEDMAFVGGEDESSVDQIRGYESLGEYIEDEEQPSDSKIIAELLEGIHDEENEISFMEKEEYEFPRAVVEAQVGGENENNAEHIMEDMAFASPRNIEEYKGNSTGIEEEELDREMSGLIKEMSDEGIDNQKRKHSPAEETHEENEEFGRALIKDMSQEKGNMNLTIIPKKVKEAENEISLMEKKESEMPRDSLWAVVIEAQVSEENDNYVEQVMLDMAFLGGESENNVEQVRGYEEDVGEKMEDEAENEILAGIKWAENEISLIEKDESGMPTNSVRAVVLEAQVSGENENNIEQVTEDVAVIIPTIEVEKDNRCRGNDAGLEEGELRRETTGLIEKIRDEGKNDWKRKDSPEKEALEENEKSEKGSVKDVSDEMGNKDLTVILEKPKLTISDKGMIQGRKSDTSIDVDESGLMYEEPRSSGRNQLVVNVKDDENCIATEVHQGISSDNLGTSVLSNKDREMTGESGFYCSDIGTEEPDQFADSFDIVPEGDDVSLNKEVEVPVDYREVVIESLPVSETTETAPDQGTASSDKVKLDEDKIWEQINAMRTIVGYKDAPHFSCAEELKALYVFTGVEPPATCKGPADLADINENLHFLMSIVGVK